MPIFNPSDNYQEIPVNVISWTATAAPTTPVTGCDLLELDEVDQSSYVLAKIAYETAGTNISALRIDFPAADMNTGDPGWICEPLLPAAGEGIAACGQCCFQETQNSEFTRGKAYLKRIADGEAYKWVIDCIPDTAGDFSILSLEINYKNAGN